MPTASTNPDTKTPVEVQPPIKQAIAIVEKKVRNLEKRKTRLDTIKQKVASGHQLETDQRNAIEHYDEVISTLEYSRELQKQFVAISNEAGKLMKKQARREKMERQSQEMKRIQELLKVQNLLDSLGAAETRNDFQTGKHGAVVLTEENLTQLDELYQLISPSRDGEGDYLVKLNAASEHIVSLLDGRNKEVVGTTYKDLKELIDLISACGYFEAIQKEQAAAVATEAPQDEVAEEHVEDSTEVASSEDDKTDSQAGEPPMELPVSQPPQESPLDQVAPSQLNEIAQSAYYTSETYQPCQRPVDEIVSAVQGSYNFLQESTIDVESPHSDPAVVAAQPMPRQSTQPQETTDSLPLSGFGTQAYGDRPTDQAASQAPQITSNNSIAEQQQQQRYTQQSEQTTLTQQNMDFPSQPFRQNALSQNLQNESLFPGEDQSHAIMNQTGSDNSIGQFDIPPSIPMPQSQDNQQSNISNQSEKKFTMNASAPVFQSMYSQAASAGVPSQMGESGAADSSANQTSDTNGGNYQNNRYQNDGFQQRGPRNGGGGFRGRGGRGGNGGNSGNMQNGFNRNNSGGQNSGGRGGRGGSTYQGYPPRGDYRPDGFQGYNNNTGGGGGGGFNAGYQKGGRGGGGGSGGGQMRGSANNNSNRGSGGGMRGGPPRGNAARSGPRGGGGGFGRPNAGQYQ